MLTVMHLLVAYSATTPASSGLLGGLSDMKQKLLTAKGDELSRLLGAVLIGENCVNCIECEFVHEQCFAWHLNNCEDACPIPLNDWNVAMKWRDWAVKEYGEVKFKQAMIDMYALEDEYMNMMFGVWLACYAQPEHYLIAAALCKLKGTK